MSAQSPFTPKFRVLGYVLLAAGLPLVGLLLVVVIERRRRKKLRRELLTVPAVR